MPTGSNTLEVNTAAILDGSGLTESRGGYQGEYAIERAFVEKQADIATLLHDQHHHQEDSKKPHISVN